MGLHLPNESGVSLHFLQQILTSEKLALKMSEVSVVACPNYPELGIKSLYTLMAEDQALLRFLPCEKEGLRINRDFIWRVVYNLRDNWAKKVVASAAM